MASSRALIPPLSYGWILASVVCLATAWLGCEQQRPQTGKKNPLTHSMVVKPPPVWLQFFQKKKPGLSKPYDALVPGLPRSLASEIHPSLGTAQEWRPTGLDPLSVKVRYQAGSEWVRSIEIRLPPDGIDQLRRLWGRPKAGQVDGRSAAFFWFDESRGVQAIAEKVENHGVKLGLWPYLDLDRVLDTPTALHGQSLSRFLGREPPKVGGLIRRTMTVLKGAGMVMKLDPLKYHTRQLTCRVTLDNHVISQVTFKLETIGNPGLKKRLERSLSRIWKEKKEAGTHQKAWSQKNISVSVHEEPAPPMRPPHPTLHISFKLNGVSSQ